MKGKPWTVEDENRLKQMLQAGKSVRVIAKVMGKTRDCVRIKIARSNIEVVVPPINQARTTTSNRFKGLLLRGSSR
jgi:IS30 family transposase